MTEPASFRLQSEVRLLMAAKILDEVVTESLSVGGPERLAAAVAAHSAAVVDVVLTGVDEYVRASDRVQKVQRVQNVLTLLLTVVIAVATVSYTVAAWRPAPSTPVTFTPTVYVTPSQSPAR